MANVCDKELVPCKWCGNPTPMTGTKMCDGCRELNHRISLNPALARKMLNRIEMENAMYTPAD